MYLSIIVSLLTGLATAIPLVIKLVEYVQKAIKEKNWNMLLKLIMSLMAEAEEKFETGEERKEWVLSMVDSAADTINYDIDHTAVSHLIDSLCTLTKSVNTGKKDLEKSGRQSPA